MRARASWDLWTTTAEVVLDRRDRRHLAAAEACVREVTDAVDLACSRFRPDSELMLRADDLVRGTAVSPMLAGLVGHALDAAAATDGDVDPTLGHRLASLGYDLHVAGLPAPALRPDVLPPTRSSWRDVMLNGRFLRVPDGVRIDLGATAKAVAADLAAASITARLGIGAVVNLGGDVATAGESTDGNWQVLVQDLPADAAEVVGLASGWAVATSSTQKRRWEQDGRSAHHILDPRWGMPAETVWRTVSVVAPTCVAANTLTTAAVVRGRRAPEMLLASGRAARLVAADGTVTRLNGWPDAVETRAA